jgi:hypothetical protein
MREAWTTYAYRCDGETGDVECLALSPPSEESWREAGQLAEAAGWYVKPHIQLCPDHPDQLVQTWTYSQVNGTDITHDLTFTGTDEQWAEHLNALTHAGIEIYNASTS